MEFRKYQHIERLGTSEVQGILDGRCHVFYKIDGTNASVWLDGDGEVCAGSRNRELTLDNDNAGFYNAIKEDKAIIEFLRTYPDCRLYGEWLVPHSLRTYRENAWRKFYVFDVCMEYEDNEIVYISYETYASKLEKYKIDYIPPIAIIDNPSVELIYNCLDKTDQFLIQDGKGNGEGLVVKNYSYKNKYHRQTWAKVVSSEFKEKHTKVMGAPQIVAKEMIEVKIVDEYCTQAFIDKEYSKIVNECDGWSSRYIPRLLSTVYHELIKEESWNIIKKYKNPIINYKTLFGFITRKIKEIKSELF